MTTPCGGCAARHDIFGPQNHAQRAQAGAGGGEVIAHGALIYGVADGRAATLLLGDA